MLLSAAVRASGFSARLSCALITLLAAACGGGSGSPTEPQPPPSPAGTPVSGLVFYDENANGVLDPGEAVRLPGVAVIVGGRSGTTTAGGQFTVASVAAGAQAAQVRADSLPAYFLPGAPVTVQVPQAAGPPFAVPAVLPIGTNHPNRYIAFGDSISAGDGSSDGSGYRSWLEANVRTYWGGTPEVRNEGITGTRSSAGEGRMDGVLARDRPAYSLILYGTNDWNELECKVDFPCFTISSLRSMIRQAKDRHSVPVVGTIIPVNPAYADKSPPERQDWVNRMNDLVRPMAREEGAVLADLNAAMSKEGDLASLFYDHVHPNDRGYAIIGREWARAVTAPGGASAAGLLAEPPALEALFSEPGRTPRLRKDRR
jgi:lysophospholipase L1-like esterase